MKILVIGLGSMGRRRIRLCKNNLSVPIENIIGVDARADRCKQAFEELGVQTFNSIQDAVASQSLDCAFICTAPSYHSKIILQCLELGLNIFSEINLVDDDYEKIIELARKENKKLFLSSTPLYRKELEIITQKVKSSRKHLNYTYHVGQYLPDWHPWENISDFFVSDKRTNGCRELFGIELPWLLNAFGEVESVSVLKSKNSELPLNYDDNYIVTIVHKTGHKGVMCVDILSRRAVRDMRIVAEDLYLTWGGTADSLIEYDFLNKQDFKISVYDNVEQDSKYSANIIENMYVDEIIAFFNYIELNIEPKHSFEQDKRIINLMNQIEGV